MVLVSGVNGGHSAAAQTPASSTNHGCIAATPHTHRSTSPVQWPSHPVSSLLSLGPALHQSRLHLHQVLHFISHSASQEKGVQASGINGGYSTTAQTPAPGTDPDCATATPHTHSNTSPARRPPHPVLSLHSLGPAPHKAQWSLHSIDREPVAVSVGARLSLQGKYRSLIHGWPRFSTDLLSLVGPDRELRNQTTAILGG
ncbi:hypothetical protein NDU88_007264 [Pleurodeles waltl]|uniref:Uncharacterized protein n=1 Tax=Pleurodeles waltl TaxID=8319 RepID=A0AAV7NSL5_PLEWA|nr:hypothetical protein NDU88_007264 [Pleurodeles waltl]